MILEDYLLYNSNSESPEDYHIWVFLSMVASVIGKKAWVKFQYFNVYPNMFVTLVSLPGMGKKSTAMRIGRSMVEEADVGVKFAYDSVTKQALIQDLEQSFEIMQTPNNKEYGSSALTAIASELVTLLADGTPMVDFLTDIYDSDKQWRYKTKNKGENVIVNPCFNLISGATTDRFCSDVIKDAVAGGFISRCVIVFSNQTRLEDMFAEESEEQLEARGRVIDQFREIAKLFGHVTFSKEAKELFNEWREENFKALQRQTATNAEFQSRKHIHIIKCAMLLAVSDLSLIIEEVHIKMAIELLRRVEHNMKFIYMSAGDNKNNGTQFRILNALNFVDSLEYGELLSYFIQDVDKEEFERILATLESSNLISIHQNKASVDIAITPQGKKIFEKYA